MVGTRAYVILKSEPLGMKMFSEYLNQFILHRFFFLCIHKDDPKLCLNSLK